MNGTRVHSAEELHQLTQATGAHVALLERRRRVFVPVEVDRHHQ